ncbi:MAG TPA: tail fiber domain-containing protein [Bacteroidales bacterium]
MKRFLFLSLVFFLFLKVQAQINVPSSNNVGIGTTNPISKLSVGGSGNIYSEGYFFNANSTASLNIGLSSEAAPGNNSYGLSGYVTLGTSANYCKGVWGSSYSSTALSNGRAYGVHGYAGNATSGYNYGVYGQLAGSNNGAAIYGVVPGYGDVNTLGQYAGYFLGNVKVSGYLGINATPSAPYDITTNYYIRVAGVTVGSDQRLKENIKDLSGALTSLSKLKGVTYRLKPRETDNVNLASSNKPDTGKIQSNTQIVDTARYNRNHIGFLAQDVQKIFPELVFTDGDGMLSVDYISLIPVLVESLKEVNKKVDALATENAMLKKKLGL